MARTRGTCTTPDCDRPHFGRGLCRHHYNKVWKRAPIRPCVEPGCTAPAIRGGWGRCADHPRSFPCTVPGCDDLARVLGMCHLHYQRMSRTGTTDIRPRTHDRTAPLDTRFHQFADIRGDHECWPWRGCRGKNRYGRLNILTPDGRRTSLGAHRVAYELYVGPIPDGLEIDHLCRNRACVNPAHLEPVTRAENIRRAMLRLDDPEIIRLYVDEGYGYVAIADQIGVNPETIKRRLVRAGIPIRGRGAPSHRSNVLRERAA